MHSEKLVEYVRINQYYMTAAEMAEELNVNEWLIRNICKARKLKPVTKGQRNREFILAHGSEHTVAELMDILKLPDSSVHDYCRELGITPKTVAPLASEENKKSIREDMLDIIRKKDPDHASTFTKILLHDAPRPRFKDKYNQSGSAILDELRGIQTTERVTPTAHDARL